MLNRGAMYMYHTRGLGVTWGGAGGGGLGPCHDTVWWQDDAVRYGKARQGMTGNDVIWSYLILSDLIWYFLMWSKIHSPAWRGLFPWRSWRQRLWGPSRTPRCRRSPSTPACPWGPVHVYIVLSRYHHIYIYIKHTHRIPPPPPKPRQTNHKYILLKARSIKQSRSLVVSRSCLRLARTRCPKTRLELELELKMYCGNWKCRCNCCMCHNGCCRRAENKKSRRKTNSRQPTNQPWTRSFFFFFCYISHQCAAKAAEHRSVRSIRRCWQHNTHSYIHTHAHTHVKRSDHDNKRRTIIAYHSENVVDDTYTLH